MILKPEVQKTLLIITDGIGHNTRTTANAFAMAHKPTYDTLFREVPYTLIATSGLSVGLPEGQMGNSEVGHMCIGSGRILYQNLVKISLAAKDGSLATNPALNNLLHVKSFWALHVKRIEVVTLSSESAKDIEGFSFSIAPFWEWALQL